MARRRGRQQSTLPLLPGLERPPEARLANGYAMRADWADPDDIMPGASRTARAVHGFRAWCPIRRSLTRLGPRSGYTSQMVEAADMLRLLSDGARIGFSAPRDGRPITDSRHGPVTGPTRNALRQLRSGRKFDAAWSLLDEPSRQIVSAVVLGNLALRRIASVRAEQDRAKSLLVAALQTLAEHFDLARQPHAA
jgi:hypothetical protein